MTQRAFDAELQQSWLDAEEGVLGSLILADGDLYFYGGVEPTTAIPHRAIDYHKAHLGPAVAETLRLLRPENFYRDRNGWIYQAIVTLKQAGTKVDLITVAHTLTINGKLKACGGWAFLALLVANTPTTVFLPDYAKIVKEGAEMRAAVGRAHLAEERAFQGKVDKRTPPQRHDAGIGF